MVVIRVWPVSITLEVLSQFISFLFSPRMLQEDPVLFQLYKDLVVSQVISAEEFWANRLKLNSVDHSISNNNKQEVGISAAFLVSSNAQTRARLSVNVNRLI